jgi:hypothetical protein
MKLRIFWMIVAATLSPSVHSQVGPLFDISGKWANDLKITAQSISIQSANYFWVGKIWGLIEPSGKFYFRTENGCHFEGLAQPYGGHWEGQANISRCENPAMNKVFQISFYKNGSFLDFSGNHTQMGVSRIDVTYSLKATLSRY